MERPLGFTVPFRVATSAPTNAASEDVVMGGGTGVLAAAVLKPNTYGADSLSVETDFTFASTVTV